MRYVIMLVKKGVLFASVVQPLQMLVLYAKHALSKLVRIS